MGRPGRSMSVSVNGRCYEGKRRSLSDGGFGDCRLGNSGVWLVERGRGTRGARGWGWGKYVRPCSLRRRRLDYTLWDTAAPHLLPADCSLKRRTRMRSSCSPRDWSCRCLCALSCRDWTCSQIVRCPTPLRQPPPEEDSRSSRRTASACGAVSRSGSCSACATPRCVPDERFPADSR